PCPVATERVEVRGHIVDSLILAKVLDIVLDAGADYHIVEFEIGRTSADISRAAIDVTADDEEVLARLLTELQAHGANRLAQADAQTAPADTDGVLPEGFYSTTNLPTQVRRHGRWVDV